MTPWWLRPTAEGSSPAEDSAEDRPGSPEPEAAPASGSGDAPDAGNASEAKAAPDAEADAEPSPPAKTSRPRRRRGGAKKAAAKAAAKAAEEPAGDEPAKKSAAKKSTAKKAAARKSPASKTKKQPRRRSAPKTSLQLEELEPLDEPLLVPISERTRSVNDEKKIAMFCDLENIALGVRDSDIKKFDINLVLARVVEKGKIIVKKAYADWERYSEFKRTFHEAAIEMIDIPQKRYSGKNSADIKMAVDALEQSYTKDHLDTFVVLSGDSDFSPLVSKLKENNKNVIGVGVKNSSSSLLIDNCDEFLFYEDIWRDAQKAPKLAGMTQKTGEAMQLMVDAIKALTRENKDVLWGSMIKQTMQRKKPSFNEGYFGYSTFSELLEDAERKKIIKLKKDQRSGTYVVTGFAGK